MKRMLSVVMAITVAGGLAACSGAGSASSEALSEAVTRQAMTLDVPTCTIDDEALEHACLHASFGPFRDVTAAATGDGARPDVSRVHTAFNIALPSAGCTHRGFVTYTPAETREVAVYLNAPAGLRILDAATAVPVECSATLESEICPALKQVYVAELEAGKPYIVEVTSSEPLVRFLVEEHVHHDDHEDHDDHEGG